LAFFYFLWMGLIEDDTLSHGLNLLLALVLLGFLAGNYLFGKVDKAALRSQALGITLAAEIPYSGY